MSEIFGKEKNKQLLKEILKKLHQGADPLSLKTEFKDLLNKIGPKDIAEIEQELIQEGMNPEEIHKLCDVHLEIFKESIEKPVDELKEPIRILMEEHKILLGYTEEMKNISNNINSRNDLKDVSNEVEQLVHLSEHLKDSEKHYLREENALFPMLEKKGISGPPQVMWAEHNEIRKIKKEFYRILDDREKMDFKDFSSKILNISNSLNEFLKSHFYKEDNILFPTALRMLTEEDWDVIINDFKEIGFCCFSPEFEEKKKEFKSKEDFSIQGDKIVLETGSLSKDELETILNTLPIDITFVDKDDTVKYFSQSKDRIFVRTKAVLGRKVQMCHPKESIHRVQEIIDDFKNNKRDVAEFWINLKGRLVYIRYFALRKNGEFLGVLEVTQDITDIKKIEGEKRLL